MKKATIISAIIITASVMPAFSTTPTRKLKEVTVTSIRPMKEIGDRKSVV